MIAFSWKQRNYEAFIGRGLEGFQSRSVVEVQPSGVAELDAAIGGGFPQGTLVELCGPASSGRTSLAFSLLAQATERQKSCAFVDVSDSLDPLSLAAAGVELSRLLWVRCGESEHGGPDLTTSPYFAAEDKEMRKGRSLDAGRKKLNVHGGGHPRESLRGVEKAIPTMMRRQAAFATSAQIQVVARCGGEQVERDREILHRGIRAPRVLPPRCTIPFMRDSRPQSKGTKPWKRLEQALASADLLLHGGGWGVIVFDLGGISWVDARRIDLSVWFRFRRAVENTPTILLLLEEESCAKSCASLVLRCQRAANHWNHAAAMIQTGISTFEGFEVHGEIARSRTMPQPADLARWRTQTP